MGSSSTSRSHARQLRPGELVQTSNRECQRKVREQISLFDSIRASLSQQSESGRTQSGHGPNGYPIPTSHPYAQPYSSSSSTDLSMSTSSTSSSGSGTGLSPITPISSSPQSGTVSPSLSHAWASPWTAATADQNDAALKEFIKQPVTPEMICYLALKTEQIIEDPTCDDESGSPTLSESTGSKRSQWPSLRHFIANLVERADLPTSSLMVALVYLDRFRIMLGPGVKPTPGVACRHRIFLACVVLTCKYLQDSSLKNRCWAKCSLVPDWTVQTPAPPNPDGTASTAPATSTPFHLQTADVTQIEREMLFRLNWKLSITAEDLYEQLDFFLSPIRYRQQNVAYQSTGLAHVLASHPAVPPTSVMPAWKDTSAFYPNPGSAAVVGLSDRMPSLSPPSQTTSGSFLSRRSNATLATPASASIQTSSVTSSGSSSTRRRRRRLHLSLTNRKSFANLSSGSPIGGRPPPPAHIGLSSSGSTNNLLHPTNMPNYPHHPYATYSRAQRPRTHAHTHSSTSTISTLSAGSAMSGSQVPIYAHPHFINPSPGSRPSAGLHPHVRQPSSGVDQAMFDAAIAGVGLDSFEKRPGSVAGPDGGLPALPSNLFRVGFPSVQQTDTRTPGTTVEPKLSRMSSFWARLIPGRS